MDASMKILCWGTRGLVSSPHRDKAVYGGNTSCIQLLYKDHLIVVDTGFGVTNLGEKLMERILSHKEKLTIHIFYTHYHWDHIQGLPFFHPIYFPETTINICSPLGADQARDQLDVLFDGSYSPFSGIGSMPSSIHFHQIDRELEIDGLHVSFCPLDHGWNGSHTYAYCFQTSAQEKLVIAMDHEVRENEINAAFIKFARACDLLVHDGQYFGAEYDAHQGWGHSSVEAAIENAIKCEAKALLLTHHSPERTDYTIRKYLANLKHNSAYSSVNPDFAQENHIYPVSATLLPRKK